MLLFFKQNERLSHNTWCCIALWHQAASEGTSWMSWLRSPWKSGVDPAVFLQTLTLLLWMGSQGANTVVTSNFHGLLSNLLVITCFALSSWTISILLRYCLHYSHTYLGLFFFFWTYDYFWPQTRTSSVRTWPCPSWSPEDPITWYKQLVNTPKVFVLPLQAWGQVKKKKIINLFQPKSAWRLLGRSSRNVCH